MNLQELEKLHSLKEKGIITEEEFNERKKQLLDPRSPIEKEFVKLKNSFFESLPTIKLLLKKGMEKGNAKLKNSFSDSLPSLRLLLKKGFVYIFSILSFLSLWGIFAYSLRAFDYKMSSKEMMTIFTLLFISFLFFMFMSRRFFKKIPNVKKHEKFISLKKVYNKAIIIITIILLVITAGLDAKFYFRNNSTQYEYYGNGQIKTETHYKSSKCVNPIKEYYESGVLKTEKTCDNKSSIEYYENGKLQYTEDEKGKAGIFYMADSFVINYESITRIPSSSYRTDSSARTSSVSHISRLLCAYDGKLLDSSKQKHTTKEENACKKYADMIKEIGK